MSKVNKDRLLERIKTFFGKVPLLVWVILCLAVAVFYVIIWPQNDNPGDEMSLRYIILRWFHPLAWVLLALSLLVRSTKITQSQKIANFIAFLALPTYAAFFIALLIH